MFWLSKDKKNNSHFPEIIAAIEICVDVIKVVVGYELKEDTLAIIFADLFPFKVDDINVFEEKKIFKEFINNVLNIEDENLKLKIKIKKAIIILPSSNLHILEFSKKKSVSNLKKINFPDMENIVNSIKKIIENKNNVNERIADIIPLEFQYDTGSSTQLPVNMISDTLEIKVLLQLLPKKIVDNYDNLLKKVNNYCDFKYKYIISSQAKIFLNKIKNFVCIEIKKYATIVDFVSCGRIICSETFDFGTKQLIEKLKFKFGLNEEKAEKLCSFFGLDKRPLTFDPVIYQNFENDEEKLFKISDLNKIIEEYFETFFFTLNNCIKKIFEKYTDKNYKFLIIESDFKIKGFFEFIKNNYKERNVEKIKLNIIGLRDEKYLTCAGAILSATKKYNYNNIMESFSLENKQV